MIYDEDEVLGKAYDGRLVKRFIGYLRPYGPWVALVFFLIFLRIGADLVGPLLLKAAVDGPVARGEYEGLVVYVLLFFAVISLVFLVRFFETWITNRIGQGVIRTLRLQVFGHLQKVPLSYYDRTPVGRMVVRTTRDIENLNELFTSGLIALFNDFFLIIGLYGLMFYLNWKLALIMLGTAPVIGILLFIFRKFVRKRYRELRRQIARLNSYLTESIQGLSTILMFQRQEYCGNLFRTRNEECREVSISTVRVFSIFHSSVEALSVIFVGILIWYGGHAIVAGSLTFGAFLAFWYCAQKFFSPIRDLSEKFNILQAAMASSERIFKLLDTPPTPGIADGEPRLPEVLTHLRGEITFENVSFSYDGKTPVLTDVSFTVRPGERVAIVGLTGAGKTTLLNLLLRFYEVGEGRILVDGKDLREYDMRALRRQTGLVLQDISLFAGTVHENIRMGADLSDARVREVVKMVGADRFVSRLPQGFDTTLSERGASISIGERQLLSFARALAFDPRILLLDEATSSVDRETENLIQKALGTLLRNRTSLVVAHRLSTIQNVDRILVLHHGRIQEEGTHDELLRRRGLYRDLCSLQFGISPGGA
jgi:ATP-binding cassette subfamily B protein